MIRILNALIKIKSIHISNAINYFGTVFLLIITIACGGGGGNTVIESSNNSSNIKIAGVVDFENIQVKNKSRLSPLNSEVSLVNIFTGDEIKVKLNNDLTYTANVERGSYMITAKSSVGKVFKLIIPDIQSNLVDANVDLNTTTVAVFIESRVSNSLSDMNIDEIKTQINETTEILNQADSVLINSATDRSTQVSTISLLSLTESIRSINEIGNSNYLLSINNIKNEVAKESILDNYKSVVAKGVIERTGKSVYFPVSSGNLVLNNISEVNNQVSIINLNINIINNNNVPIADAGKDLEVIYGDKVVLDGSKSYDLDVNDTLSFSWSQVSGNHIDLLYSTNVYPEFMAPRNQDELIFVLKVSDGKVESLSSQVKVNVQKPNSIPVANAGEDQTVYDDLTVKLNGLLSYDTDNDLLSYKWTQIKGTRVNLSSINDSQPSFFIPYGSTDISFSLVVNDGNVNSVADETNIFVVSSYTNPISNAGADKEIPVNSKVQLDGSLSSGYKNSSLNYKWEQLNGEIVDLSNVNESKPTFIAPNKSGELVFSLTVKDNVYSSSDNVVIKVTNTPPVANAGPDQNISLHQLVTLDGSSSYDFEKASLSFKWSQVSGGSVLLSNKTSVKPVFTAPKFSDSLEFQLEVSDGEHTSRDYVFIYIYKDDSAPTVKPEEVVAIGGNSLVALSWKEIPNSSYYTVHWDDQPGQVKTSAHSVTVAGNTYVHIGAENGKTNYYSVSAVIDKFSTENSLELSATPKENGNSYLLVDISKGPTAKSYPVTTKKNIELTSSDNIRYKTNIIVLKWIAKGDFIMGQDGIAGPVHKVILTKGFFIGLFETTRAQWLNVMLTDRSQNKNALNTTPIDSVTWEEVRGIVDSSRALGVPKFELSNDWPNDKSLGENSFMYFLSKKTGIKFDLPTEAQWEYACRAGTTTVYYYGDAHDGQYQWDNTNSGFVTHEVGLLPPNAWGLFDMHGNLSEWCLDRVHHEVYAYSSSAEQVDPLGLKDGTRRIRRGGSFIVNVLNSRSAERSMSSPDFVYNEIGFRIVCQ